MKIIFLSVCSLLTVLVTQGVFAQTLTEIKLVSSLEEDRGWCVDLFAHLDNALPVGGFQGHSCFTYMGNGPAEDQAFDLEGISKKDELRLVYFDRCLTMYEPNAGSFVAAEPCDGRASQKIVLRESGRIVPKSNPDLCLTIGPYAVPGGGSTPVHLIRKLSFEACDSAIPVRQRWELRTEWKGLLETTQERPYRDNPAGRLQ